MYNYRLSCCLLIKDENGYINEWLSHHIDVGVEHFYIYDNGSATPICESVSDNYLPYCTFIDFSGPHFHTQNACYADCLNRFGRESEWIAFIDTYEFIHVIDGQPLPKFLEEYGDHDALYAKWTVYNADGQMKKEDRPVRDRFHQVVPYQSGLPCGKSIVRPSRVKKMGPHVPCGWTKLDLVDENHRKVLLPFGDELTTNRITIDHYFTRSLEEWNEKMARGSCDPVSKRRHDEFWRYNPDLIGAELTDSSS